MCHWPRRSPHLNDVDLPDQKKRDLCSHVGPSQCTDHRTWCPTQSYRYCSQLTDLETGGGEEIICPGWRTGAGTLDHVAMLPHGKPSTGRVLLPWGACPGNSALSESRGAPQRRSCGQKTPRLWPVSMWCELSGGGGGEWIPDAASSPTAHRAPRSLSEMTTDFRLDRQKIL